MLLVQVIDFFSGSWNHFFSGSGTQLLLVVLPACCLQFAGLPGQQFDLASPVSGFTLNWEISVT